MSASVLLIKEDTKQGYAEARDGDGVYINRPEQKRGVVQEGMIQTIKANNTDIGVVVNDLRIRKLTPRECWRLMGCSDEDFNKAQSVCSNSQLYKQAGNAIVVDTFQAILKNMI
jgi:DNA (cytosine-5)-methyltransferase 1